MSGSGSGSGVAAIGEAARVQGFALAGVAVHPAEDAAAAVAAWAALPDDVVAVLLTASAARALAEVVAATAGPPFPVVMPT